MFDWRTVTNILKFEDKFIENLADILKEIKKRYRFGEFEIDEFTTSWVVQDRKPDIAIFVQSQPFLIIECKRAIEHSVWDDFPIGQVYSYALFAKKEGYRVVDYLATANQYYMAIFRVPENLEDYANWDAIRKREYDRAFKRELFLKTRGDLQITGFGYDCVPSKESVYEVLKELIERRGEIEPEPFTWRVIKLLNSFVEFIWRNSKDKIESHIKDNLQNEFF